MRRLLPLLLLTALCFATAQDGWDREAAALRPIFNDMGASSFPCPDDINVELGGSSLCAVYTAEQQAAMRTFNVLRDDSFLPLGGWQFKNGDAARMWAYQDQYGDPYTMGVVLFDEGLAVLNFQPVN